MEWINADIQLSKNEAIYRTPDRDGLRSVFLMKFESKEQAKQFFSPIPLFNIEWLNED